MMSRKKKKQVETLLSRKVDGLIFTPIENDPDSIRITKEAGVKFVLMGELIDGVDCDFVTGNDFEAGRIATEHLVNSGHRRIAYFGSSPRTYSCQRMLAGYQKVLNDNGLKLKKELVSWENSEKKR